MTDEVCLMLKPSEPTTALPLWTLLGDFFVGYSIAEYWLRRGRNNTVSSFARKPTYDTIRYDDIYVRPKANI